MVFHFPPMNGGGIVVIVDIINKLAELGNDVTVITPNLDWKGDKYTPILNPKIKIIRTDTPSKSNIKIAARRCQYNMKKKALQLGKEKNIDFIFSIFHPFHLVPKAAVESAKKLGIPSVVKVDDAIYEKSSGIKSIQRRIEKIINGKTLRSSDNVLVSNIETQNVVIKEYNVPLEKISIVPNGVDLSVFRNSKQKDPKKIVFTGAMYHHRGLDILLNAIPKVIKKIPDAKFFLIGSGNELEKLKQIVKKNNLEDNVEFTGWIKREEIPERISDASIGIGPLRLTDVTSGALPIKVLEYMAASLPIIAQKGTLQHDVLKNEKNGYFVENQEDLSEKIILLLTNPEKIREMGEVSNQMVQKFSWDSVVSSILEISQKTKNDFG